MDDEGGTGEVVLDDEPTVARDRDDGEPRASTIDSTMRMRKDQVERRALPFRTEAGGRRQADAPALDPNVTGKMRPVRSNAPPLPFAGVHPGHDAAPEVPSTREAVPQAGGTVPGALAPPMAEPMSATPAPPPAALAASIWSQDVSLNPEDLPSALAPTSEPEPAQPPPKFDPIVIIVLSGCALIVVICALVVFL